MSELSAQLKSNWLPLLVMVVGFIAQWALLGYRIDQLEQDVDHIQNNYVTQKEREELLIYLRRIDDKLDRIAERGGI